MSLSQITVYLDPLLIGPLKGVTVPLDIVGLEQLAETQVGAAESTPFVQFITA